MVVEAEAHQNERVQVTKKNEGRGSRRKMQAGLTTFEEGKEERVREQSPAEASAALAHRSRFSLRGWE
ncbi:uncharacterized protein N7496_002920 [Penicillium cataractarum]|uniref:Uncharacterized protein n=1 Tax=Penicillium cataractarum TaxID=2100454 RepID=A0A9W9SLJ2_9EURO|nr:uncharacterized protein N7496_002920 [Penicillium cataractarum]KAJ5380492.1 hypothetical protein N7496_002920 [Penicillium cataractarum]